MISCVTTCLTSVRGAITFITPLDVESKPFGDYKMLMSGEQEDLSKELMGPSELSSIGKSAPRSLLWWNAGKFARAGTSTKTSR